MPNKVNLIEFSQQLSDAYLGVVAGKRGHASHGTLYQNIFTKRIVSDLSKLNCFEKLFYWKMSSGKILKLADQVKKLFAENKPPVNAIQPNLLNFCDALTAIRWQKGINLTKRLNNKSCLGLLLNKVYYNNKQVIKDMAYINDEIENKLEKFIPSQPKKFQEREGSEALSTVSLSKTEFIQTQEILDLQKQVEQLLSITPLYKMTSKPPPLLSNFHEVLKTVADQKELKTLLGKYEAEDRPLRLLLNEVVEVVVQHRNIGQEKTDIACKLIEQLAKAGFRVNKFHNETTPLMQVLHVRNYPKDLKKQVINTLVKLGASIDVLPIQIRYLIFKHIDNIEDFEMALEIYPALFDLTDPNGLTFIGSIATVRSRFELLKWLIMQGKANLEDYMYKQPNQNQNKLIDAILYDISQVDVVFVDRLVEQLKELIKNVDASYFDHICKNGNSIRENIEEAKFKSSVNTRERMKNKKNDY